MGGRAGLAPICSCPLVVLPCASAQPQALQPSLQTSNMRPLSCRNKAKCTGARDQGTSVN